MEFISKVGFMIIHYRHIVSLKHNQNVGHKPTECQEERPFSDQTKEQNNR